MVYDLSYLKLQMEDIHKNAQNQLKIIFLLEITFFTLLLVCVFNTAAVRSVIFNLHYKLNSCQKSLILLLAFNPYSIGSGKKHHFRFFLKRYVRKIITLLQL